MKVRELLMVLLLAGGVNLMHSCGGGNVFEAFADKNSAEACRFQVSQDLDKGRYDAVLNASCATHMDKGAAWFGKAGFDVNQVIDRLVEAGGRDLSNINSINIYVKTLVPDNINEDMLGYLDNSITEYTRAQIENARDAGFYRALVHMVKSMTIIKISMPVSTGGTKTFFFCDINNNNVPDDADALACALYVQSIGNFESNPSCSSGVTYTITPDINLQKGNQTLPDTYRGIKVNIQGQQTLQCKQEYKLLFYKTPDNQYVLATTNSRSNQVCKDNQNPSQEWPCPILGNNQRPLNFLTTVSSSITNMFNDAIYSIANTESDLRKEIERIRKDACGPINLDECTPTELRNYIIKITWR